MSALTVRPGVAEPPPWTFPAVEDGRLSNGARLCTIHVPGQYIASVRAVVTGPLAAEPTDLEGVATLVSRTLDEGTRRRSGEEFAAAMERHGAHYGAWVFDASAQVGVDVAIGRLGPALELMAEALTEPVFPADEVARHVALRIAEIDQDHADPGSLAAETFARYALDDASRLSRPVGGSAETVRGLDPAAARAWYDAAYGNDRLSLVVAGDLTGLDVHALADAALGGWSTDAGPAAAVTAPGSGSRPRLVVVDRPGSVQTELVIGSIGPDRSDPAWSEHVLAARMVGGTLTSRLDAVLREEKGYTYGFRAAFTPFSTGGLFSAHGSVRTEVTGPALADALAILARAREGFTDTELEDARQYLTRMAPMRYETSVDIASQVAANIGNGVGVDFVDRHQAGLAAASGDGVTAAWVGSVEPARLVVVAVGDASGIESQLADLDLTPYGLTEPVRG
jgi:zinc protease